MEASNDNKILQAWKEMRATQEDMSLPRPPAPAIKADQINPVLVSLTPAQQDKFLPETIALTENTQDTEQLVRHEEPTPQHKEPLPLNKERSLPVTNQSTTAVTGYKGGHPLR